MSDAVTDKPRHERFDEYWEQHKRLVYYVAKRLAPRLGCSREELVGSLTLWFNYVLWYYDPDRGSFSNFFCRKAFAYLISRWIRKESQSWDNFMAHVRSTSKDLELSERNYAQHEADFHLYRVPEEDETDVDEIVGFFEGLTECWEFMTRPLGERDRQILWLYYHDGWTLDMIGQKFTITKERVRQLMNRSKEQIRARIQGVRALAHLFAEDEELPPRGLNYEFTNQKRSART